VLRNLNRRAPREKNEYSTHLVCQNKNQTKVNMSTSSSVRKATDHQQRLKRTSVVSQPSTAARGDRSSERTSRRRVDDDDDDDSTLSSSRVGVLEEEIERVTMENTKLVREVEKLRENLEKEKKEKEHFHKRVMEKALQTVTMEKETYAKVKRYAQEKMFRKVKFITSENELKDLQDPESIAGTTMNDLGIKEEDRIAWWSVYKVAITDGIADRRNQINTNMKTWVLRKYITK
jgi:regulator of replication initiation timing